MNNLPTSMCSGRVFVQQNSNQYECYTVTDQFSRALVPVALSNEQQNQAVSFDLLKEAQQMDYQNLLKQLLAYFPQVGLEISELTTKQAKEFIGNLIKKYQSSRPFQQVFQYNFPTKQNMEKIILEFLPDFRMDLPAMNIDQLKELFQLVVEQVKKTQLKIEYLKHHPFQVTIKEYKPYFVSPSYSDLLQLISQQKTKAEIPPALTNFEWVRPEKRSFEEMNGTNTRILQATTINTQMEESPLFKKEICENGLMKSKESRAKGNSFENQYE